MLRFALTPSGDMHIANLRVALLNSIIAQQRGENLIVRIEDTDKEKYVEGKEKEGLEILALFGIQYTQVIYQSQNIRFHSAMALQLLHDKKAFSCFCSPAWLDKKQEEAKVAKKPYLYDDACRNLPAELVIDNENPFTIRINRPDDSSTRDKIDSFVIMSQDKTPTSNFSCAVDDMLNDISIVIRDAEYINNTPKQEHIRNSLGYNKKIEYIHLPMILDESGNKLSMQEDISSVKWLLEEGYLPDAIANYLLLMGNTTPKEIFTPKEALQWLKLETLSSTPTSFSIERLKQINKKHLQALDAKELSRYVGFADEEIGKLDRIYLKEVATTKELKAKIAPIFEPRVVPDVLAKQTESIIKVMKDAPFFEEYQAFKDYIIKESGLQAQEYDKAIRILLSNANSGPDLAEIYKYIKNYLGEIIK